MVSFLVPDILLQIVQFVLVDVHTAGERWGRLLSIMLVNKLAYTILVEKASLWRWVDADYLSHTTLFSRRAAGRRTRPVVTYHPAAEVLDVSKFDDLTVIFEQASPVLYPEALFVELNTTWTLLLTSLRRPGVWTNLRVLLLSNRPPAADDWDPFLHAIPLSYFPRLESLAVTDCIPIFEPGDGEAAPITSLVSLFVKSHSASSIVMDRWIRRFNCLPNLQILSLDGFAGRFESDPVVTLHALQKLRLLPFWEDSDVYRLKFDTPMLECAVVYAPRGNGIQLNNWLKPNTLLQMVRFLHSSSLNYFSLL